MRQADRYTHLMKQNRAEVMPMCGRNKGELHLEALVEIVLRLVSIDVRLQILAEQNEEKT